MTGSSPKPGSTRQQEIQSRKIRDLENDLKEVQNCNTRLELEKADLRKQLVALSSQDTKRHTFESRIHSLKEDLEAEKRRVSEILREAKQQERASEDAIAKWQERESELVAFQHSLQESLTEAQHARDRVTREVGMLKTKYDKERMEAVERSHEIDRLETRITTITTCWESAKAEAQSKSSESAQLTHECERLRERNLMLVSQVEELKKRERDQKEKVASLERHLEERHAMFNGVNVKATDLEFQLIATADKLKFATNQCEILKTELEQARATLEHDRVVIDGQLSVHTRNMQELNTSERLLKEEVQGLRLAIHELERQKAAASVAAAEAADQNHILTKETHVLKDEVAELALQVASQSDANSAHELVIKNLEVKWTEAQSKVEKLTAEKTDLLSQCQRADVSRQQLVDNMNLVVEEKRSLSATCESLRSELRHQQDVDVNRQTEVHKITKALEIAETQLCCSESSRLVAEQTVSTLQAERTQVQEELARFRHEAAMVESSLRSDLEASQQSSVESGHRVRQLQEEASLMVSQVGLLVAAGNMLCHKHQADLELLFATHLEELGEMISRVAAVERIRATANSTHERALNRQRDELSLKFNKERDAVVVHKQKLSAAENKAATLEREHSSTMHRLNAELGETTNQLEQSKKLLSHFEARKDEYKNKYFQIKELFETQQTEKTALYDELDAMAEKHAEKVRSANVQYRRIREGLQAARVKMLEFAQQSDVNVQAVVSRLKIAECIEELGAIIIGTNRGVETSVRARRAMSDTPVNSPQVSVGSKKRERVEEDA